MPIGESTLDMQSYLQPRAGRTLPPERDPLGRSNVFGIIASDRDSGRIGNLESAAIGLAELSIPGNAIQGLARIQDTMEARRRYGFDEQFNVFDHAEEMVRRFPEMLDQYLNDTESLIALPNREALELYAFHNQREVEAQRRADKGTFLGLLIGAVAGDYAVLRGLSVATSTTKYLDKANKILFANPSLRLRLTVAPVAGGAIAAGNELALEALNPSRPEDTTSNMMWASLMGAGFTIAMVGGIPILGRGLRMALPDRGRQAARTLSAALRNEEVIRAKGMVEGDVQRLRRMLDEPAQPQPGEVRVMQTDSTLPLIQKIKEKYNDAGIEIEFGTHQHQELGDMYNDLTSLISTIGEAQRNHPVVNGVTGEYAAALNSLLPSGKVRFSINDAVAKLYRVLFDDRSLTQEMIGQPGSKTATKGIEGNAELIKYNFIQFAGRSKANIRQRLIQHLANGGGPITFPSASVPDIRAATISSMDDVGMFGRIVHDYYIRLQAVEQGMLRETGYGDKIPAALSEAVADYKKYWDYMLEQNSKGKLLISEDDLVAAVNELEQLKKTQNVFLDDDFANSIRARIESVKLLDPEEFDASMRKLLESPDPNSILRDLPFEEHLVSLLTLERYRRVAKRATSLIESRKKAGRPHGTLAETIAELEQGIDGGVRNVRILTPAEALHRYREAAQRLKSDHPHLDPEHIADMGDAIGRPVIFVDDELSARAGFVPRARPDYIGIVVPREHGQGGRKLSQYAINELASVFLHEFTHTAFKMSDEFGERLSNALAISGAEEQVVQEASKIYQSMSRNRDAMGYLYEFVTTGRKKDELFVALESYAKRHADNVGNADKARPTQFADTIIRSIEDSKHAAGNDVSEGRPRRVDMRRMDPRQRNAVNRQIRRAELRVQRMQEQLNFSRFYASQRLSPIAIEASPGRFKAAVAEQVIDNLRFDPKTSRVYPDGRIPINGDIIASMDNIPYNDLAKYADEADLKAADPQLYSQYQQAKRKWAQEWAQGYYETHSTQMGHGEAGGELKRATLLRGGAALNERVLRYMDPDRFHEFVDHNAFSLIDFYNHQQSGRIALAQAINNNRELIEPIVQKYGRRKLISGEEGPLVNEMFNGRPEQIINMFELAAEDLIMKAENIDQVAGTNLSKMARKSRADMITFIKTKVTELTEGSPMQTTDPVTLGAYQALGRTAMRSVVASKQGGMLVSSIMDVAGSHIARNVPEEAPGATKLFFSSMKEWPRHMKEGLFVHLEEMLHSRSLYMMDIDTVPLDDLVSVGGFPAAAAKADKFSDRMTRGFFNMIGMGWWNNKNKIIQSYMTTQDFSIRLRKISQVRRAVRDGMPEAEAMHRFRLSDFENAEMVKYGLGGSNAEEMLHILHRHATDWEGKPLNRMSFEEFLEYKGAIMPDYGNWAGYKGKLYDVWAAAINGETLNKIVEPKLLSRPASTKFMLGKMVHQFWSFSYAWSNQQLVALSYMPQAKQMQFYLWMVSLGAVSDALHNYLQGRRSLDETAQLWGTNPAGMFYRSFDRSGLPSYLSRVMGMADSMGIGVEQLTGADAGTRHTNRMNAGAVAPVMDYAMDIFKGVAPIFTDQDYDVDSAHKARSTLWFQNVLPMVAFHRITSDMGIPAPFTRGTGLDLFQTRPAIEAARKERGMLEPRP